MLARRRLPGVAHGLGLGLAVAVVLALLVWPAMADVTTYPDRASWACATTGGTTVDFEGIAAPFGSVLYSPPTLTLAGVTFAVDPTLSNARLFVIGAGLYAPTSVISSQQASFGDEEITITLPSGGATAVAFDQFLCGVTVTLSTGEQFQVSGGFFGVTSTAPITSLRLDTSASCGMMVVDNFSFAEAVGCSCEQRVELACPADGTWRNHGQYVSCVASEVNACVADGLISSKEGAKIKSEAARSNVGK